MKRVILCVLLAAQLVIGSIAMGERRLYEIETVKNQYYVCRGGVAYLSDSFGEGNYRLEGRILLQNISKRYLGYDMPVLYVYQNNKKIAEIPAVTVTPKSTAPKSMSLLSFSGLGVPLNSFDGIKLSIISNVHSVKEKEKYIGMGSGELEESEYSDGLRISKDISDLKQGIYVVNLIVFDEQGRFVWGEDVTVNRELYDEANNALQDYEVELLRDNGLNPAVVYGEIYRKK